MSSDEITDILITHIHTDHTGGLVENGKLSFPKATVHVAKADVDFFLDPSNAERSGYGKRYFDEAAKTIGVAKKMNMVKSFSGTETILPGTVAMVHPGHTPGSAFYTLSNGGQSIVFIGDIIHVAAVQYPNPEVTIVYDVNPMQAKKTRVDAFAEFSINRQLIAAPHLPFPGVGHMSPNGQSAFTWFPTEYRNRAAQ